METKRENFPYQKFNHIWFVVSFSLLFFIVRIPFFSIPLFYEEGIFENIFINRIHGPEYGQIGRINGEEIYTNLIHPGFIYETIAIAGQVFQKIVPMKGIPKEDINFRIRAAFTIFQFLYWLWIIFILVVAERKKPKYRFSIALKIALVGLSITPLFVHTSYTVQVDNSVGVMLAGFFGGFLLLWYLDLIRSWTLSVFSVLSGLVWGIGKNEWTILLILSMVFTFVFLLLRRFLLKQKTSLMPDITVLLFHLLGCICGNILNYLFDPVNYLGGQQLIFDRAISIRSGYEVSGATVLWFNTMVFNSPYLFMGIIGSIVLFAICLQRIKDIPAVFVWGASLSVLLFFFFFFASFYVELRVFSPSYVLQASLFVIAFFMLPLSKRRLFTVRVGLIVIFALSFVHYGKSLYQMSWDTENSSSTETYLFMQYQKKMGETTGCVPWLDIANSYDIDSLDYLSYSLSFETSEELAARYGRQLCTQ